MSQFQIFFSLLFISIAILQFQSSLSQTTVCPSTYVGSCSPSNDGNFCYYNKVVGSSTLRQTYGINKCFACSTRPEKVVNGECPGTTVYCDPRARPQSCSTKQVPVCGYRVDSYGKIRRVQTYANPCTACKNPPINHYVRGKC